MNNQTFESPLSNIANQDVFGQREVGLTHPDVQGFIRIRDDGDIEIIADAGVAIIMHRRNETMTIVADRVNFMTRNHDGLRWNHVLFNRSATKYNQPTFIAMSDTTQGAYDMFEGIDIFLKDIDGSRKVAWVTDEMGNKMPLDDYIALNSPPPEEAEIPEYVNTEYWPGRFSE